MLVYLGGGYKIDIPKNGLTKLHQHCTGMTKIFIYFPSCTRRWEEIFEVRDFEVSKAFDVLLTCSSLMWDSTRNIQIFCCDIHPLHILNNSLWSPTFRGQPLRVAVCCKSLPKAPQKESNLFSLKLVSLWSKEKAWKDFFSLRRHESLLLYSINYLLSCYIPIPRACWRKLRYFIEEHLSIGGNKENVCAYL